jgi:hypothetical protein
MSTPLSTINPNYHFPGGQGPEYLIKGREGLLDEIADRLPEILSSDGRELKYARPAGFADVPGLSRGLRVIRCRAKGHDVFTDITMLRTGSDLFMAFTTHIRTSIAHLRRVMYFVVYVVLFAVLNSSVFALFDIADVWLVRYRNTYQQGQVAGVGDQQGLDSRGRVIRMDTREDRVSMMRRDPYLFLAVIAPPVAFIGVTTGFICWLIPAGWLSSICRLLAWPTPEEITKEASAHRSHVNTATMTFLFEQYGIDGGATRKT